MNLKQKIGQMMVVGFKGIEPSEEVKDLIKNYHVGGIILFGRNIGTPKEILNLTRELQALAKEAGHERPLFICIDQENGSVRRLGEGATIVPGAMLLGATGEAELAYEAGKVTGTELKALGINWNLAPVVDVNNNAENPVIGVRSFGEDAKSVAEFAKSSMKGMQEAGIMTTLKHFPGHGDTNVDSHLDLPVISHDLKRLHEVELVPFKQCIAEGSDTVMTAHVYFPTIEPEENRPATLSKQVITGLLRNDLSFDGVVTTDCMEMDAIANRIGTERGGVEAVKAGVDLVMVSHLHDKQMNTIEAIYDAVNQGELSESRIDESISRINRLKDQYLSWDDIELNDEVSQAVGSVEHRKVANDIYKKGLTIAQNNETLPLNLNKTDSILVVYPQNDYATLVEDTRYSTMTLGESVKKHHDNTDIIELKTPLNDDDLSKVIKLASNYNYIIVGTLNAYSDVKQQLLVQELIKTGKPIIAVATRSPYDLNVLRGVKAAICTYEFTKPALQIVSEVIFGKAKIHGKLPVTIKDI